MEPKYQCFCIANATETARPIPASYKVRHDIFLTDLNYPATKLFSALPTPILQKLSPDFT
uniref:Cyclin-A2 n=1 Tax=Arundo donax TaxID=35708 RepID=A0A0A9DD69_ARUDO